jgi:two-component system response regulator TctD
MPGPYELAVHSDYSSSALSEIDVLLLEQASDHPLSIEPWLRSCGCSPATSTTLTAAAALLDTKRFELIVLALELAARELLCFVRELVTERPDQAIVVVSSQLNDADTVVELQRLEVVLLPRPYTTDALQRVVSLALKNAPLSGTTQDNVAPAACPIVVDSARGLLTIDERAVRLTPRLFKLFSYLLASSGRPIPAMEIARNVLDRADYSAAEAVRGAIRELRRALRDTSVGVETSRGYGYLIANVFSRNTHVRR